MYVDFLERNEIQKLIHFAKQVDERKYISRVEILGIQDINLRTALKH